MKITIDISDFYLDEEQDIETALKQQIIHQVVNAIDKSIKEKVEKQISLEVKDVVEKTLYQKISKAIGEVIKTSVFKRRSNNEIGTIEEYIKDCLSYNGNWNSFDEQIKKLAQMHAKEIKDRYDLLFASQIVSKLGENGLLNSEAAKLLLNSKSE